MKIQLIIFIRKERRIEMIFNYFAAIDIFNLSLVGCSIVFGLALVLLVLFLAVQCKVTYIDAEDGKAEIHSPYKVSRYKQADRVS